MKLTIKKNKNIYKYNHKKKTFIVNKDIKKIKKKKKK